MKAINRQGVISIDFTCPVAIREIHCRQALNKNGNPIDPTLAFPQAIWKFGGSRVESVEFFRIRKDPGRPIMYYFKVRFPTDHIFKGPEANEIIAKATRYLLNKGIIASVEGSIHGESL